MNISHQLARAFCFVLCLATTSSSLAQTYKKLPPDGIKIDAADREQLFSRVRQLQARLASASKASKDSESWVPNVEVLVRAVDLALTQNLFFKQAQTKDAARLLDLAAARLERATQGKRGLQLLGYDNKTNDKPQLLVGGFRSRIDESAQPFGLVIPAGFKETSQTNMRFDVWLHGRGDTKTEIPFLMERLTKVGQYAPPNTVVLHPFGRHCNAFKFAGETDVYEAMDHVSELVPVNRHLMSIRGFSMGGAGCWHFTAHDPTRWFASNPGAGFVDTRDYQGWIESTPYEFSAARTKLLNWYDVLPWVQNLSNTRVIAYSGEVDKQRKAAERMYQASQATGIDWPHVIGEKMGHKINEPSKVKIAKQLTQWQVQALASDRPRRKIDFTTFTTHYHQADWLSVTGLIEHWTPGRIRAEIDDLSRLRIQTNGITHFAIDFSESGWKENDSVKLFLNDDRTEVLDQDPKRPGFQCNFVRLAEQWAIDETPLAYRKRPGLQGPIDDAFCERFLFVVPSRPATHGVVQRWINRELLYAQSRWERLMRGDIRYVKDTELTEKQIADCHLICFGDFSSNRVLARIKPNLPISWTRDELRVGDKTFRPNVHVPVFCYPNPLNPNKYVVVNSGMTYREFSNVSNSRQIAMLPDWAILNVDDADDGIFAGEIAAEGFFDEGWKLP